jgi:hypothetical protein
MHIIRCHAIFRVRVVWSTTLYIEDTVVRMLVGAESIASGFALTPRGHLHSNHCLESKHAASFDHCRRCSPGFVIAAFIFSSDLNVSAVPARLLLGDEVHARLCVRIQTFVLGQAT